MSIMELGRERSAKSAAIARHLVVLCALVIGATSPGISAEPIASRDLGDPGACCGSNGCEMLTALDCHYSSGIWHADATCDSGICDGACCTSYGCDSTLDEWLCATLYGLENWYAGEVCAEAGGTFQCPSPELGACCTPQGCFTVPEDLCHQYFPDVPWIAGADCADNPCPLPQGACCLGDQCLTTDKENCWALAGGYGSWYSGETCPDQGGTFACPSCSAESLFCQHPSSGDNSMWWWGSDSSFNQTAYERFWGLAGDVCSLRWYGYMLHGDSPCSSLAGFVVRFYDVDEDLLPGTVLTTQYFPLSSVTWTPRPEWSAQLQGYLLTEFQVSLSPCVPIHDGYVSIAGVGQDDCAFYFTVSYEGYYPSSAGDCASCMLNSTGVLKCARAYSRWDLPIELSGPEILGACCDDTTGVCEMTLASQCVNGRFQAGVSCEDLDPPCGAQAGACCDASGTCQITRPEDCQGYYAGDGTTCAPIDCNANGVCDACDIAMGTSLDCNGNHIPDECDIAAGVSDDYDADGIPDECDPDRNGNGVPDACDIDCATGNCSHHPLGCGGSMDCQGDGVPDDAQLGTLGSPILWDNGAPILYSLQETFASQEGGSTQYEPMVVVDDFVMPGTGPAINGAEFYTEVSEDFEWTGRVHIRVYANRPFRSPEGALWQIDGSLDNTAVDLWVPDSGGTVSRVWDNSGYSYPRYKWVVSGLDIRLAPGRWFIGFAPEAAGSEGYSIPCYSRHDSGIVGSEAWYAAASHRFLDIVDMTVQRVDLAFRLLTDYYGVDDNHNGAPDECESVCGDLDFDSDVDYDDYVIFLSAFGGPVDGNPPQDAECDFDESGAVGLADYAAWLECYRAYIGDPTAGPPEEPWTNERPGFQPIGEGLQIKQGSGLGG